MKNFKIRFCFILVASITLANNAFADDLEYWSAYKFKFKINDRVNFILNPQIRLRDDISEFYYYESVQGLIYKFNKNFEGGLFHLYADDKNTSGKWTDENRARVQVTFKTDFGDFKFSTRNRYEYRVVGGKPKSRYRNRLKLVYPITLFNQKITPYISNEFFIVFRVDDFNQNRTAVGFSKKLTDSLTGELFFLIKSKKTGSDWAETNVIGTSLTFKL